MRLPAANIKDTPFAGVKFTFVNVTPELAADLLKQNQRNRKLKETTVDAYAMDMRNDAWLTTHQGVAFDAEDNLIDGQHRLHGVVRSRKAVLMLITTGWPAASSKRKTMDAVDRGTNRSLADQLHLQHGIEPKHAGMIVVLCNNISAACWGNARTRKATTDTILAVFDLYKNEIKWFLEQDMLKKHGIKQASVAASLIMARAVWADKTQDALHRLQTGENLTRENPLLPLRNWLMGVGQRESALIVRMVTLHHLAAFVDGKACPQIVVNSNAALIRILKLHKVRVDKICAIYGQATPEFVTEQPAKKEINLSPTSPEAIAIGNSLTGAFSSLDVAARTEANVGPWFGVWLAKGWIERSGTTQFIKTAKFGKGVQS